MLPLFERGTPLAGWNYFDFQLSGQPVPVDRALLIEAVATDVPTEEAVSTLSVSVVDPEGVSSPGQLALYGASPSSEYYGSTRVHLAWRPLAPLAPLTEYTATITVAGQPDVGPYSATFQTSAANRLPPSLPEIGAVRLVGESDNTGPVVDCEDCGGDGIGSVETYHAALVVEVLAEASRNLDYVAYRAEPLPGQPPPRPDPSVRLVGTHETRTFHFDDDRDEYCIRLVGESLSDGSVLTSDPICAGKPFVETRSALERYSRASFPSATPT